MAYEHLAQIYDTWTAENNYGAWTDFIVGWCEESVGPEARTVLDLCCGTGRLTELLRARGFDVSGVDRSPQMLEAARVRLGSDASLTCAELPSLPHIGSFDAVVCTFDSLNYIPPKDLGDTFRAISRCLRPGGLLVFDVNTSFKLAQVFGDSHYGDLVGPHGYVWRNRLDLESNSVKFLISLFLSDGTGYIRVDESHTQYWFDHIELCEALSAASFNVLSVTDDYSHSPVTDRTLRATWVARSNGGLE